MSETKDHATANNQLLRQLQCNILWERSVWDGVPVAGLPAGFIARISAVKRDFTSQYEIKIADRIVLVC